MIFYKKKKLYLEIFLLIFLTLYSVRSGTISWKEAQLDSYDFKKTWGSLKLLSEKINHYEYSLKNINKIIDGKRVIENTEGSYSHLFYIILYPFSLLDWEKSKIVWSSMNILLTILIPFLIGKKLNLSKKQIFIAITMFFISFPVRTTIAMGQHSLLILLFFSLPFLINNKWSIMLSGISYCKYNIGYALFLYYLKNKKYLFYSLIPSLLGWLFYSLITNSNIIINLFEPFRLTILNPISTADLEFFFGFLKFFKFYEKFTNIKLFLFLLCIFANAYLIFKIQRKIKDSIYKLSLISLSTLIFLPHWGHDYVFLLPLVMISAKYLNTTLGKINIFLITYFIFLDGYLLKFLFLINIDFSYITFWSHQYLCYIFFFILLVNLNMYKEFNYVAKN